MFFSCAKFAKDDAYILWWKIPPAVGQGSWSSVEYLARRTQRVKSGVPISDIMKVADWSQASTFKKFYQKPIKDCYGIKIL